MANARKRLLRGRRAIAYQGFILSTGWTIARPAGLCDFAGAGRLQAGSQDWTMSDLNIALDAESDPKAGLSPGLWAGVPGRPLRILIVDDNKPFAETLSWVLEGAGDQIETSHNGPCALEIARRFDPDIIFLDIVLPVVDGYDVCRQLRAQSDKPDLKIFAQSGYGDTAVEAKRRGACFDAHLVKPLDLRQVVSLVNDIRRGRA